MLAYVLRRLLWMVPTLLGITLLLMVVLQLAPGDPAAAVLGDGTGDNTTVVSGVDVQSAYDKFRERYRLDDPILVQYVHWLGNVLTLDFGYEFFRPNVRVADEIWRRLGVTVPLAGVSVLLSYLLALPLGILSAMHRRSLLDRLITLLLFLLYSLPTFWVGLMLMLAFGATGLDWFPVLGLHDKDAASFDSWGRFTDLVWHAVLPVATLTYGGLAYLSRQMRSGMLETLQQDFIRTARAKGLSERRVVLKHALRNSLIPVVTIFASILPVLIGGSIVVEMIFGVPGMGLYAYEALLKRDYNVIMATVTFSSFMTLLGFLVSDILYAVVDPRITLE